MKRSEINRAYRQARQCFARNGWALPPNPKWDITDFGLADFPRYGLTLINLAVEPEYSEKLMYAWAGQTTPCHTHRKKKEDIICRAGRLALRLWTSRPESEEVPGSGEVTVPVDGLTRRVPAGRPLILEAGQRITLVPGVWHAFAPEGGECVIGEVSTANDDLRDNFFLNPAVGRFPGIEEDEPGEIRLPERMSAESTRAGIVAGGNWIVDHVKMIDAWPPEDSLASVLSVAHANGGSPYNILKDLAKLGASYPLEGVGLIGDDADGGFIVDDCRRHGIDAARLLRTPGTATSCTDVMTVQATGRRTFFHQAGANARLGPEHFDFSGTRARHFHLGYLLLLDGLDRLEDGRPRACEVLRRAHEAGLVVSLDCVSANSDRFRSVVRPALPDIDLLFANDLEAERLTGVPLRDGGAIRRDAVERAARELIAGGVRQWVILHFPEGACALSASGEIRWQASVLFPAELIKGVAGAGDAFAAGVLHGRHEGWTIDASLRLGVCAAASCLSDATCSGGILPVADCLHLGDRWGFHSRAE